MMETMTIALCSLCKTFQEIVYTDDLQQKYCAECVATVPLPPEVLGMLFLSTTIPFRVGDKVECRFPPDVFEGTGTIANVYFDLEHGGTPVYPMYGVQMDDSEENAEVLYTESCLTKL